MNRKQQSVVLAGLLALALAGCSSTKGGDEAGSGATSSGTGASGSMGSGTSAPAPSGGTAATSGAESTSGSMAGTSSGSVASPTQPPSPAGAATMPSGPANAVVMSIEAMPRPGATAGATGSAAVGSSGAAGTTGSSGEDKMYRVTLRMDDGTTRVVTQDKAPTFRNGDRVNMMDGMITH